MCSNVIYVHFNTNRSVPVINIYEKLSTFCEFETCIITKYSATSSDSDFGTKEK